MPRDDESLRLTRALREVQESNRAHGVMSWSPELLSVEDDMRPPTAEAPRLFISYRWEDIELESWLDMIVGSLVGRGYRVVFDRDPRNFARGLSRDDLLFRMSVCDYFVAVLSEGYSRRVMGEDLADAGAATDEWEQALQRARAGSMRMIGLWHSGETVPPPFTLASVVDMRPLETPNLWEVLDRHFPELDREGEPVAFDPPTALDLTGAAAVPPVVLQRSGFPMLDQNRLVIIEAWKEDGSCDQLGPFLIRQLERMAAQLKASGKYVRITTRDAGEADD